MGNWMIVSGANLEIPRPQSNTIGAGETEPTVDSMTKKAVKGNKKYFQTVPELIRKRLATSYTDPYAGQNGVRHEPHFLTGEERLRCQNLGAASSNPVQTRQDTIDVDCVLGNVREEGK